MYSGPAINVLAITMTAKILGWQRGLARAVGGHFCCQITHYHLSFDYPILDAQGVVYKRRTFFVPSSLSCPRLPA
nr:hypothetical protein [uncultured Desulfobacter sp.]